MRTGDGGWSRWAWALIGLGVLLRVRMFLCERSLWLDELMVANNLIERGFLELTQPLDQGQIAPIGWLWLHRCLVLIGGDGELALRTPALIAGVLSLPLFYAVARRCLPERMALVALAMLAGSSQAVYYAAELKPYSFDLTLTLLVTYAALRALSSRVGIVWRFAWFSIGAVGLCFSLPLIFVLGATSGALLIRAAMERRWIDALWSAALGAGLLIQFLAIQWFYQYGMFYDWLRDYWEPWFFPVPPRNADEARWIYRALADLMAGPGGLSLLAPLGVLLFAIGVAHAARRRPVEALLLVGPMLLALIASALERYPFSGRLILYLAPAAILASVTGLSVVLRLVPARWGRRLVTGVVLAPILAQAVIGLFSPLSIHYREEARPVLSAIASEYRAGDGVLLNYWAEPAWRYYRPRVGLPEVEPVMATREYGDIARYEETLTELRESGRLRGRWWVILIHFQGEREKTPRPYTDRLQRYGHSLAEHEAPGVFAGLYQFDG